MGTRFYIRIAIMLAALYGIISVIRSLDGGTIEKKAQDPSSALSILIGNEMRPMNWCPPATTHLQSAEGSVIAKGPTEIAHFCEVMTTSAHVLPGESGKMDPGPVVLFAVSPKETVELRLDSKQNFSAKGLPFQSEALLKQLKSKALKAN